MSTLEALLSPRRMLALPFDAAGAAFELAPMLVNAILILPQIAANLDRIAEATDVLPEMERDMATIAEATRCLPAVHEGIQNVSEATSTLPEIQARTAAIEQAIPDLVELERALVELERSLPDLTPAIQQLSAPMERMLDSLDRLDITLTALAGPAERFSRLASRFPGRRHPA
jgi:hypothetical protein